MGRRARRVYVPTALDCVVECISDSAEVFVAGAKYEKRSPFAVLGHEIDMVQYGSDDTKTHRKIKHILGQKQHGQVGRAYLAFHCEQVVGRVSDHKHSVDREGETKHDRHTISDLSQIMAEHCSCFNVRIQILAKLFM